MKSEFSRQHLFLKTSKQVWDFVSQTYSKVRNTTQVYELKQVISWLKKGDLPSIEHYSTVKQMWEEMDHYLTFCPKYQDDIVEYARHVEEFHIYELLTGLHPDFEQVRVNIVEVYVYLHHEEKRHSAMSQSTPVERSALVSSSQLDGHGGSGMHSHGGGKFDGTPDDRDKLKCEHCSPLRHTKNTCWDLHGRLTDSQPHSFSHGRGGGRFGGNQPSAHKVTFTPSLEPILAPTSTPAPEGILSHEEINVFFRFVAQLEHLALMYCLCDCQFHVKGESISR